MSKSEMSLSEKVAFITGGARGIGRALAEALLDRGSKVAIVDINQEIGKQTEEELAAKYGDDKVLFCTCDVTNTEQMRDCYNRTLDRFGHINIVINNAGVIDEVNFERMMDINLLSTMRSCYMAVEHMRIDKGGNGGHIINMASTAYLYPNSFFLGYSASKYGVVGFTKSLAVNLEETATMGIKVGALCPDAVRTDMTYSYMPEKIVLSRDCDVTMPQIREKAKQLVEETAKVAFVEKQAVVDGMIELLSCEVSNGGIIAVEPSGVKYIYPDRLVEKSIPVSK